VKSSVYAQIASIKDYNMALTDPPHLSRLYNDLKWYNKFDIIIKKNIFEGVSKRGIENAHKTFVMSKWNSNEFKKIYKVQPKIIHPGIFGEYNKKGVTCKILHSKKNLNLISVGRLVKSKNLIWLLLAVKYLLDKNKKNKFFKDINLKILGSGPELKNLKDLSKKLNIAKNIKFYGSVSESKKNKLILESHINLIAAYSAYNLPALESIRMGVPVVINEACRMSEVLKNNIMAVNTKNNQTNFIKNLDNYIERLKKLRIKNYKVNHLPTFNKWANDLSTACEWYGN
jgi:glycosyltransferase involved in cell wall biosynthesis